MRSAVIEKMLDAYYANPCPHTAADHTAMTAAAKVLLDEVLGPVTEKEWCSLNVFEDSEFAGYLEKFITARRAKIEQPKTIEGRVTVTEGGSHPHAIWIVQQDGENVLHMKKLNYSREDAETYRLGRIAQLKSKEQQ